VSFIFGGALLGVGTYFGVQSRSEHDELRRDLDDPTKLLASDDHRLEGGRWHAITADALFGLGGITMTLGLYYALRNPGADSMVEVTPRSFVVPPGGSAADGRGAARLGVDHDESPVTPVLGPAGIGLQGRF
jgi:hypothetical protein